MKRNKICQLFAAAFVGLAVACANHSPVAAEVAVQTGDAPARRAGEVAVSPAGIHLAWIPAGTFTMGSPESEIGRWDNEGPQRQVTISEGFWMGVHPVTQEQWEQVMGSNPSYFQTNPAAGEAQGRRPVETVSWFDVLVFANLLSKSEGLRPAYMINGSTDPANWGEVPASAASENLAEWNAVQVVPGSDGWRLPTEAQREFAARAGTTAAFSNGAGDWQNQSEIEGIGWFGFNSGGMTREVGLKQPNPWGLHDIHGNVLEWAWDWFGEYPNLAETDPAGASSGAFRVIHGGSWFNSAEFARSASRFAANPSVRNDLLGLRIIRP